MNHNTTFDLFIARSVVYKILAITAHPETRSRHDPTHFTRRPHGGELPPAGPMPEPLRKVDLDMLGLVSRGLTNQEIANKLAITVGATKWRMTQIFGKLQVRNRIEALAQVRQLLAPAPFGGELPPAGPMPEPLSKVELDMLMLVSRGLTNQEIANKLAITVGTTKWRLNQIFGKLQVRNRIEALARAGQLQRL